MGGTQESHSLPAAPRSAAPQSTAPDTPPPSSTPADGGLPGTGGTDGFGGFGRTFLKEPVGRGQANAPDDVHQASTFLHANGILPSPTRDADEGFLRGVEKGQEKLNALSGGGLRIDGIAKPWGPTEILSQRAVSSGRMNPPRPAGPGASTADQVAAAKRVTAATGPAAGQPAKPIVQPPRVHTPAPSLLADAGKSASPTPFNIKSPAPMKGGMRGGASRPWENTKRLPGGGIEGKLPADTLPGYDPADQGRIGSAYGERDGRTRILPTPPTAGSPRPDDAQWTRTRRDLENNGVVTTPELLKRPPINEHLIDQSKAGQVLGKMMSGELVVPAPGKAPNGKAGPGAVLHIGGAQIDQRTAHLMSRAARATPQTLKSFQRSISEANSPGLEDRQRAALNRWAQNAAAGRGFGELSPAKILTELDSRMAWYRKFAGELGSGITTKGR